MLNLLGLRYVVYHLRAEPEIPNLLCGTCKSSSWLLVSNVAVRSSMTMDVSYWFSMAQSRAFTNFTKLVSQPWNFLYAD